MGVIINNQNTKILGFTLKGRPLIPSAEKKYETIEIDGRNGALTRFVSYEDLKFKLTFNILFQNDIKQKLREIKGLMSQAKTLSFDDAPNFYYKVKQAHLSDTETIIKSSGVFTVEFVCDSFEYEASSVLESVSPNLNLLNGTRNFKPYGAGDNTPNQNAGDIYFTQNKAVSDLFKAGDYITISYDVEFLNTDLYSSSEDVYMQIQMRGGSWTWLSQVKAKNIDGKFYTRDTFKSSTYVENPTHKVTVSRTIQLTQDFITANSTVNRVQALYHYIPVGANINISNLKIEEGSTATPWMPSSSEEYTNTAKLLIRNNTTYYSQPIIKIFGEGNIKLTVNNELIEFKNLMDGIVLDSEKQEAYLDNTNKNSQMIGNFPIFNIGENEIIAVGKVDKMQILPQWRWLT